MFSRIRFRYVALVVLLAVPIGLVLAQQDRAPRSYKDDQPLSKFQPIDAGKPLQCSITGPFTHDNLSIFLLHGPETLQLKKFMTLPEALEKKLFVIYETQNVNNLEMENLSPDTAVVILAGDILKGGQQDRISQSDHIIVAKSGKLPLPAFCVEHTASRWMTEKNAENAKFDASPGQVYNNAQRLAARYYMNQSDVWNEVAKAQQDLKEKAGVEVKDKASDSSLALSLKVKEVAEAADKYVKKLQPIIDGKKDVIGYAFAINGKVYAADAFGSGELFHKVWPRLLQASALEAFSELQKGKKSDTASVKAVEDFLKAGDGGEAKGRLLDKDLREAISENKTAGVLRLETRDAKKDDTFLRKNYLKK